MRSLTPARNFLLQRLFLRTQVMTLSLQGQISCLLALGLLARRRDPRLLLLRLFCRRPLPIPIPGLLRRVLL